MPKTAIPGLQHACLVAAVCYDTKGCISYIEGRDSVRDTNLNVEGAKPPRYAKATIQFQATLEPYLQEFMIGPLPVSNGTTLQPLDYPFNKGVGMQRMYNADVQAYGEFLANISSSVEGILMEMFNGVSMIPRLLELELAQWLTP